MHQGDGEGDEGQHQPSHRDRCSPHDPISDIQLPDYDMALRRRVAKPLEADGE
jgi:hypothetical protein